MKGRKQKRQPTIKQIKAIQYINQGFSKRQAMIKAGYSPQVASNPKGNLLEQPSVKKMILGMAGDLMDAGLTKEYMVLKFKEWLEAQKIDHSHTEPDQAVPDYDTQLKAYDRWDKIMQQTATPNGKIKRQLSIVEFVTGEEDKQIG